MDRIGDTFRWKGENVSTNEVSEVVSVFPGILEANVYGVKVPGNEDGRACMAAIVTADGKAPDFEKLSVGQLFLTAVAVFFLSVLSFPLCNNICTLRTHRIDVSDALGAHDRSTRYKHIAEQLASYAIPQFIRLLPAMESTGTFKQRKVSSDRQLLPCFGECQTIK